MNKEGGLVEQGLTKDQLAKFQKHDDSDDEALDVTGDRFRKACTEYRLLLPSLMGFRPERPKEWIVACIRAIIQARLQVICLYNILCLHKERPQYIVPFCVRIEKMPHSYN